MAIKTAEQVVDKFRRGVAGAGTDYANGVANPSRPWAQATVAGQARYEAGVQKAISNKSFAKGVQAAGDAKWSEAAQTKGAARFAQAADQAATAYQKVAGDVMAAANAARAKALSMPDTSLEARIQRSVEAQKATSTFWASRKR
jgi:hypothetical protein